MNDLRKEVERIAREVISAVLAAAARAPLTELSQVNVTMDRVPRTGWHRRARLRTLRRALEWQSEIEAGNFTRAQIARREGLSRAAVTQSLRLLLALTPKERRALKNGSDDEQDHS